MKDDDYMKFCELSTTEFDAFVNMHPNKNFYQTSLMYNHLTNMGTEAYLVGMKNNKDEVVCASLIAAMGKSKSKKSFEALKGFLIDHSNLELLKEFTSKTKDFIKSKGGFRLFIEPYVPLIERDIDANLVEGGFDNRPLEQNIITTGFVPVDLGLVVKYTFILDINGKSSETLFNEFRPNTRNYINRTQTKYQLNVRTLTYEQLAEFKKITADTCERRDFSDKSLAYYESMYNAFGDLVKFMVVELDCDKYIEILKKEITEYQTKIAELSDAASNAGKKKQMSIDIENNEKKIDETKALKEEKGNIIALSGAMFILYGDEIIYLFSGSYKEYMKFCGQYRLQWEIIKYAADNNYKRYNFFGIQNVFDKNDPEYGVYEFKKSFNGYVEELMGSFEIGTSSYYKIYKTLRDIKNKIKR